MGPPGPSHQVASGGSQPVREGWVSDPSKRASVLGGHGRAATALRRGEGPQTSLCWLVDFTPWLSHYNILVFRLKR